MRLFRNDTSGRYRGLLLAAVLLASVAVVGTARAATFLKDKKIHLTSLHRIDGDVYAAGETVTIDGAIDGDLLAAGGAVFCSGEITGSQNIAAGEYSHSGRVDGSVRVFASKADVEGYVGRSVLFMGQQLTLRQMATVRKDLNAYGYEVDISGVVMGDVKVEAAVIEISGQIDGNVELKAEESLDIIPPAMIRGNLVYRGPEELNLEASGVTVLGEVERRPLKEEDEEKKKAEGLTDTVLRFSRLFAAFIFGLILIRLCPRYLEEAFEHIRRRFAVSAGVGLLALVVVVISVLVLILALILSLVGLILSSGDQAAGGALLLVFSTLMIPISSFVFVSGGVLFYAGKLLPSFLVGYGLIRIFKRQPKRLGKWQLLIGLVILTGFYTIPGAGLLFYLAAGVVGTGAIILGIRSCRLTQMPSRTQQPPPPDDSIPEPLPPEPSPADIQ